MMQLDEVTARIIRERAALTEGRGLLVGLSGIDGSGKGYLAKQIEARLVRHSIAVANINADGWLNLPHRRFSDNEPARHFYENGIRLDEFFAGLLLPLRDQRTITLTADYTEEAARDYRRHTYAFENIDVVLVEGIFIFKREYRNLFDLAVWLDCSFSTALARALSRRQEGLSPALTIRAYDTIYFPAQRIHFERDKPRELADLIVDNDDLFERRASLRVSNNLAASPETLF
ncbi:MAG TPA: hypothetical protein VK208_18810 [Pyrinomonadaceae bacterium]|nr:hypothetical protein [Pyrinomonadaceae bacterium]